MLLQRGSGAHAGDQEELRGLEGACGQDDFFAGCDGVVLGGSAHEHAGRGVVCEQDPSGHCLCVDLDVCSPHGVV